MREIPPIPGSVNSEQGECEDLAKPVPQVEGKVASIKDCYFAPFPSLGNFKTKREVPLADNSINEVLPENRGMG